ncbi:flippase-like domain-containing protein [Pseudomonas sp. gcc21]|uniref:lysylphosphatidylglycerol synthase transmembrane domain-containing protein n=1 Tax=Pseudomonas sp. gcc21 TaxID=2726989 RepID=UPI00145184EA|nr:lysylphosphatidylglycerol synthase transmembrane domain-containing protein [Pseudomonas sp. gcc21]QJD57704.1 flippase-like domain-containing protein [Pseudomonas sp. gcc21]
MPDPRQARDNLPDTSAKRLVGLSLLFICLSGLGIWAIYLQVPDTSLTFDFRLVSWQTLLAVAGLLGTYYLSDALRLYYTLKALDQQIALKEVFRLVFVNIFFSNITPMATGGGVAQIWYLRRHGVRLGTATAATTIRTILAVIFIFGLTPIFLLTLDHLNNQTIISRVGGLLAVMIIAYLSFFAILLLRTRLLILPISAVLRRAHSLGLLKEARHRHWQYKVRREMLRFSHSFSVYMRGSKRNVLLSILSTFVFLLSLFSFPALLIFALGYDVDYLVTIGLLVVTTFVMYFAPTPGASGISEGLFGSFFSTILGANHLVLVTIGWRVLTIYLGMVVGLLVMQRELSRKGLS